MITVTLPEAPGPGQTIQITNLSGAPIAVAAGDRRGVVTSITVTNAGSGYTSPPKIFTPGPWPWGQNPWFDED